MLGIIKVIPAPLFSAWSNETQIRENGLLQNFRMLGFIEVIPAFF